MRRCVAAGVTVIADDGAVRCQEGCLLLVHPILPILLFVSALGAHPFMVRTFPWTTQRLRSNNVGISWVGRKDL